MNDLLRPDIDRLRVTTPQVIAHFGGLGDGTCGMFTVPSPIDEIPLPPALMVGPKAIA